MSERIMLWPHPAPYTDQCGDQAQPSLKPYPAEGSRGAVVVLPGGGYQYKADHEGGQIARMLTSIEGQLQAIGSKSQETTDNFMQQAASLQEIAASMDNLNSNVKVIDDYMKQL